MKIGNVFACGERTGSRMAKRTPPLDSAHQIGLSTMSKGKLMLVGECVMRKSETFLLTHILATKRQISHQCVGRPPVSLHLPRTQ